MYVNKASVASSESESFIKFSCIGPIIDDKGEIKEIGEIESCQVVMPKSMLIKLHELIAEVINNDGKQEN